MRRNSTGGVALKKINGHVTRENEKPHNNFAPDPEKDWDAIGRDDARKDSVGTVPPSVFLRPDVLLMSSTFSWL